ncbi:MAG: hypothetical protein K9K86_08800 [Pseudomonadales bacterium]|nr:hypothetical protein [Pseudomonadales bacterium]
MIESPISSLIFPLQDRSLLLPGSIVAEITPMAGLIVESSKQRWLLGRKHWRNLRIPVIAFETLSGGSLRKHSEHACIAVFKGSGVHEGLPFWGLLLQNKPRSVQVYEDDLTVMNEILSESELIAVSVKDNAVRIPNLEYLEEQLISSNAVH